MVVVALDFVAVQSLEALVELERILFVGLASALMVVSPVDPVLELMVVSRPEPALKLTAVLLVDRVLELAIVSSAELAFDLMSVFRQFMASIECLNGCKAFSACISGRCSS